MTDPDIDAVLRGWFFGPNDADTPSALKARIEQLETALRMVKGATGTSRSGMALTVRDIARRALENR